MKTKRKKIKRRNPQKRNSQRGFLRKILKNVQKALLTDIDKVFQEKTKKTRKKTRPKKRPKKRRKTKKRLSRPIRKISTKKRRFYKRKIRKIGKKKVISPEIVKAEENPILLPIKENGWEAWQTFNPGTVLLDNKIHFLYRSIGTDGISRFGYASSSDGFSIDERLPYPVYQHATRTSRFFYYSFSSGGSFGGAEDPRIVKIEGDDRLYITYTACDGGLRVAITSIKIEDFLKKNWKWFPPTFISAPEEVHKNWVIFPEKFNGKYAILHSISPEISIEYVDSLDFEEGKYIKSNYQKVIRKNCWDNWRRGAGPSPIKTKYGWLLLYHAMSANDFSKYKVGAMLLDLKDPSKVIAVSPEPILEPDRVYENNGFKAGVVYVTGAVVKDGVLLIYYGGADSYVCVAYANLDQFIEKMIQKSKPILQKTRVTQKKKK